MEFRVTGQNSDRRTATATKPDGFAVATVLFLIRLHTGGTSFMAPGLFTSNGGLLDAGLDALVNFCLVNFLLLCWLLLLLRLRKRRDTKHSDHCKQFKHHCHPLDEDAPV
jgi:hypothetical protein